MEKTKTKKIIVVGGVALGATVATRLRKLNSLDEIVIYEKDGFTAYNACSMPYYLGNVVTSRDDIMINTPAQLSEKHNVKVLINHQVMSIDPEKNEITIKDLLNQKELIDHYDFLIMATGARAITLSSSITNTIDSIYTLRNVEDMDQLKTQLENPNTKKITIIGAGAIGLEVADSLTDDGKEVTLLVRSNRVLNVLDEDLAQKVETILTNNKVKIIHNVEVVQGLSNGKKLKLSNEQEIESDLTLTAIGIVPETELAKMTGLAIGTTGGILINEYCQTSISNIYAGGDVVEYPHLISKHPAKIALA
ncbi:unnamed protein product [Didymodactylos carnosus]|uniref:FAD/NAD(P)-binding domain-containing protein n=1 Tax=Didymodactylos carnosus TaxID=1234261 RepID=A0A8S2CM36_9BILA|nr:unnamed protein product [Didymodactylos carnosus]CAF3524019.1 unnamed protein product [Didymodactylos carnosus]